MSPAQKIRAPSGLPESSFPTGDKLSSDSCLSVTTFGKSALLAPYPHSGKVFPFSLSFLPHHFPLPSPEISLLLPPLSSPICVLPTRDGGRQTAAESLLSACETCSLWPDWLTLIGDRWRGRDSPHTRETWVSPKWEIYKEDSSSHLVSCSGWKSYHPSTLICTFLLPREAPLGMGGGSSFLLTGVCIGESPTDDVQLAGS